MANTRFEAPTYRQKGLARWRPLDKSTGGGVSYDEAHPLVMNDLTKFLSTREHRLDPSNRRVDKVECL